MSEQKNKKAYHFTPVGVVGKFASLDKPDMGTEKYPKPRGEWKVSLAIPSQKAQKLIDMIVKASERNYEQFINEVYPAKLAAAKKAGKKPPKKLEEAQYPFFEDDEGNVIFSFKSHATYTDRNTQEVKKNDVRVYDAQGKRIFDVPRVNQGSDGRVEFSLLPYQSEVAGCGIKLQLNKFQLLRLQVWAGGDSFGAEMDEDYELADDAYKADGFGAPAGDEYDADVAQEHDERNPPADAYDSEDF